MNSNDDGMQYLIIEELNKIIEKYKSKDKNEKIIIITHNNHFYLNIKYKKSYKKNLFLRLNSNETKTEFIFLKDENEDFKTNYEALWCELKFLFDNREAGASMLLNPIRRIIETFTKFNGIDQKDMLSHVTGAKKFFDVNSHSIDDLEADLNGKEKKDIISIMKECFKKESSLEHFNKYWEKEDNNKN